MKRSHPLPLLNRKALRPATFSTVLAAAIALLAALGFQPIVETVPVAPAGGPLQIIGHGFGEQQGNNRVLLRFGDAPATPAEALSWSGERIVAALPPMTGSGAVQVVRTTLLGEQRSEWTPFVVQAADLPSQPFGYQTPVQPESPWPAFRRDQRNTGRSPLPAVYGGDAPWSFATGKGIFSTPVIDGDGVIYVGSADHNFYAIQPDGREKWRFPTGEIIDSAAALPRVGLTAAEQTVLVPSGDGFLYNLRTDDGSEVWTFDARVSPRASYNNWFEGNVAIGYDGTLYAGNTNFNYYAINPDGSLQWTYPTGSNAWSIAGIGDDGTIYWGSNDTYVHAVLPDGQGVWTKRTLGFIAASAAIGADGTVYIGSFDSNLYALDPQTGKTRWRFKTNDHIYASAALGEDAEGNTSAVYVGSADGIFYAVSTQGELLWRYDTGDPIRSSAALGAGPDGQPGAIVYFGAGNGKLYALNAADGSLRWSFDTTATDDPELADRNDLNASPALGRTGVYIGGEHGQVWYVPYDYCLQAADARCSTDPDQDLPADALGVFFVTPGGSTQLDKHATIPASAVLTLRLLVREDGETVDAWVCSAPVGCPADALEISASPPFSFTVEPSADGHYIHILPEGFLEPATTYTLTVDGNIYTGGVALGNLTLGGRKQGRFSDTLTFTTEPSAAGQIPLAVGDDAVTALEWTRLATPIPPMLPSLNQIGFDYLDWIMGPVQVSEPDADGNGRFVLWVIGGQRNESGELVADPDSDFTLALSGRYQGDSFILENRSFTMPITGIPIPFNLLQMRGQLGGDGRVRPGATIYADTEAMSIPTFGPYLVIAGLANNWFEKLLVTGTYITRPYPSDGPASQRPAGLSVTSLDYTPPSASTDGQVTATFRLEPGASYPLDAHRPGILLLDENGMQAVSLDYHANLTVTGDAAGNAASVTLRIPAGTALPVVLQAVVMADVFPLHTVTLTQNP
jgi:outer membrane protein assembly factor BamB